MEQFIIRKASLNDAKAIAECHKEAVEKRAAAFYDPKIIKEWSWSPDRIEKVGTEIQNQDFIYIVACMDDYIFGYGIANPTALELKSLCTRPNKKGHVGAAILSVLLDECKKQGCTHLNLSSSLNAEKFYLDNGFRVLNKGRHILDSGQAMNCIKMRIELNPDNTP